VATIKPAAPDRLGTEMMDHLVDQLRFGEGAGTRANSGSFDVRGATLRMLIAHAYGVPLSRVIGPAWANSQRYDIVAKIPGQPGLESFRVMQQNLLAERFGLKLRPEPRRMAAYRLTVAKSGHKLTAPIVRNVTTPEEIQATLIQMVAAAPPLAPGASQRTSLSDVSLDELAARLETETDLPVKNATGLTGRFSFRVDWSRKDPNSFRDALEDQLGLILERSNEMFDVLVIEQALRAPTEN
jgi:uncharacterized protein (TIGR03435 family)